MAIVRKLKKGESESETKGKLQLWAYINICISLQCKAAFLSIGNRLESIA